MNSSNSATGSTLAVLRANLSSARIGYGVAKADLSLRNRGCNLLADLASLPNRGQLMADCKKAKSLVREAAQSLAVFVVYNQHQEGRKPSQALVAIIAKQLKPISINIVKV